VQDDPLWRLRHALGGMAIALLLSVFIAALLGRWIGDAITDSYGLRAGIYAGLLVYVVVGTVLLFMRVAQHETRPLSAGRVLTWLASLWLWPLLLLPRRGSL
jgi:polyferredoxin